MPDRSTYEGAGNLFRAPLLCAEGRVEIRIGDCLELMRHMPDASVDSCVTDPPYALTSIVKRFGSKTAAPAKSEGPTGVYRRASGGFMGQVWDSALPTVEVWAEVFRVLKPGAHLLAFGGTRTQHRLVCAIEDAGFEIRDQIGWAYGSGFPKSHKLDGDWQGWGTALKPAWEPICVARKPLEGTVAGNVLTHGTGALNVDACRVDSGEVNPSIARRRGSTRHLSDQPARDTEEEGRMVSRQSPEAYQADRPGELLGRWPANLCHDGSDEVLAAFPESAGQNGATGPQYGQRPTKNAYGDYGPRQDFQPRGDAGSAARFFYCAKASRSERGAYNKHPTVKPVALMQWLVRLVTPPGGLVLDPFGGSGTTGIATAREGFRAILMEQSLDYAEIAARRIRTEWREPTERESDDLGPLFSGGG